mmetsp:Transcript_20552/g.51009  ORF Transcript_20552/g.51009 Transcript_20552/m.51009 type:complete len:311 (-) Transcript_20552:1398-2330(-)
MPPLECAPVGPPRGDQKLVVVAEAAVGDMRAMPQVPVVVRAPHVAGVPEQLDQPEVVSRGHHHAVAAAAARVDVGAVGVLGPHPLHRPPQRGGPRVPPRVLERRRELDLLAPGNLPKQQLVVSAVGLQVTAVFAPVQVRDVAAVALAHAYALVTARGVIYVHEVVVACHGEPPPVGAELDVADLLPPMLLGDDLVARVGLEHKEAPAEEPRSDELSVRTVRRRPGLTGDVPHGDLPALVHVVHPQRLIVPCGDELRQEGVRGQPPQLRGLHALLLVIPCAVPLRDDLAVSSPTVLRAHVELEDLASLGAH